MSQSNEHFWVPDTTVLLRPTNQWLHT